MYYLLFTIYYLNKRIDYSGSRPILSDEPRSTGPVTGLCWCRMVNKRDWMSELQLHTAFQCFNHLREYKELSTDGNGIQEANKKYTDLLQTKKSADITETELRIILFGAHYNLQVSSDTQTTEYSAELEPPAEETDTLPLAANAPVFTMRIYKMQDRTLCKAVVYAYDGAEMFGSQCTNTPEHGGRTYCPRHTHPDNVATVVANTFSYVEGKLPKHPPGSPPATPSSRILSRITDGFAHQSKTQDEYKKCVCAVVSPKHLECMQASREHLKVLSQMVQTAFEELQWENAKAIRSLLH